MRVTGDTNHKQSKEDYQEKNTEVFFFLFRAYTNW